MQAQQPTPDAVLDQQCVGYTNLTGFCRPVDPGTSQGPAATPGARHANIRFCSTPSSSTSQDGNRLTLFNSFFQHTTRLEPSYSVQLLLPAHHKTGTILLCSTPSSSTPQDWMSDVSPLSGISGLSFDSTLLFPLLFFCLVLLPFLSYCFLPAGPFF